MFLFFFFFLFLHNRAKVYHLKIVLVRGSERMAAGDGNGDGACSGLHKTITVGAALPACTQAELALQCEGVGMI